MTNEQLERIVINPKVMAGKPVIKGTRIPVSLIVKLIGQGMTPDEILEDYPQLKIEDIRAAFLYSSEVVDNEEVYPLAVGDA